jgi:hypothetical protein
VPIWSLLDSVCSHGVRTIHANGVRTGSVELVERVLVEGVERTVHT